MVNSLLGYLYDHALDTSRDIELNINKSPALRHFKEKRYIYKKKREVEWKNATEHLSVCYVFMIQNN